MSGVTLIHTETDVAPECTVVFAGGRLTSESRTDSRRIEITFESCYFARVGPHDDRETIEVLGYEVDRPSELVDVAHYIDRRNRIWRESGNCPDSGFYVARQSDWVSTLPRSFPRHLENQIRHYVVDGRDGYVELIARQFSWREWLWTDGQRDDAPSKGPVAGSGEGVT